MSNQSEIGSTINSQSNFSFLLQVNVTIYFYLSVSNDNLTLVFHTQVVELKLTNQ